MMAEGGLKKQSWPAKVFRLVGDVSSDYESITEAADNGTCKGIGPRNEERRWWWLQLKTRVARLGGGMHGGICRGQVDARAPAKIRLSHAYEP